MNDSTPELHARAAVTVEQKGEPGGFWALGFKNWILNVLTLTIYRFWAKTNTRRRLWASTIVNGDPLEYSGTGMELFKGFLLAILLFLPFGLAIFAAQLLLPPASAAGAVALVYLVLFWLMGVAIFLARRYQMSRTVWRGVRFSQHGSPLAFGFETLSYTLLTAITLGWFGPAARMRLAGRLWSQTAFGDRRFRWERPPGDAGEPLYRSFAVAWAGVIVGYVGLIVAVMVPLMASQTDLGVDLPEVHKLLVPAGITAVVAILLALIAAAWHAAVLIRCEAQSVKLDGLSFTLTARPWSFFWLAVTNALLMLLTLGIAAPVVQLRVVRYLATRLGVTGTIDLAAVNQAAGRGPSQGEGLADGLDLSGVDIGL